MVLFLLTLLDLGVASTPDTDHGGRQSPALTLDFTHRHTTVDIALSTAGGREGGRTRAHSFEQTVAVESTVGCS